MMNLGLVQEATESMTLCKVWKFLIIIFRLLSNNVTNINYKVKIDELPQSINSLTFEEPTSIQYEKPASREPEFESEESKSESDETESESDETESESESEFELVKLKMNPNQQKKKLKPNQNFQTIPILT